MQASALDRRGAELVRDYLAAGRAALGAVPTQTRVIAERFFDEAGGMQLVIHAPFGGRINRAWGTALRKRFCRSFDFELQAAATDDGIVLSLGAQHSFPLETVFEMVRAEDVDELLTQAALQAPMFETRWRWNAMRALALLRFQGGRRVPPPIQRMRAQDLIAAVFPGQTACQDNHGGGAIEIPDHPLVRETMRDCLTEAMDAEGLKRMLADMRAGEIQTLAREVPEPSVFAHEILNANPYAFLDDAPLEERRTRAVAVRRGLPPEIVERIGGLDPERVTEVVAEAQPDPRNADELHDLLLDLGALPAAEAEARGWTAFFEALVAAGRAARAGGSDPGRIQHPLLGRGRAAAAGVGDLARARASSPDVVAPPARRAPAWTDREGALTELVRAHLALLGPTTARRSRAGWICRRRTSRRRSRASRWRATCCAGASCPPSWPAPKTPTSCSGAIGACSRASTAACSTGCARRSSRRARPTTCASSSPGSTCARGRRCRDAAAWRRSSRSCRAARSRPARGSARCCRRAWSATTRRGSTGSASRARWRGAGSRRARRRWRPAARRRSRSCAARDLPWLLVPGDGDARSELPTDRRVGPPRADVLSAPARDVLALPARGGRELPRRHRPGRAPPAHRGRGRALGAGRARAASPATASPACAR